MNAKLSLLAFTLAAAGSASAVGLTFQSTGTFRPDPSVPGNLLVRDTAVVPGAVYTPSPVAPFVFESFTYSFGSTETSSGTGTLVLKRVSDSALANVAVAFGAFYLSNNDSASMATTSATLVGSGWLAGYTGTAEFSGVFAGNNPAAFTGTSRTTFDGTLQAVPEPASMAALALGGLGLLRRRRKA